jgi:uncharacterized protein (DUF1800 family)
MAVSIQARNQHLLWRAGFGPRAEDISTLHKKSPHEIFKQLLKDSSGSPEYMNMASNILDGLVKGLMDAGKLQELSKEQKQQIRKQSREDLKSLNLRWLNEMVDSPAQLREKMAFFWHGHFACREINIYFQQQLLDTIRRNSIGNFGVLLREVSKSASILSFLNNQQNRKQHPNENFAREVMELFTLGRGNYTEDDIKEAARSFTGWGFNLNGDFVFRKNLHDEGKKTVLGKTGNFDGDDVLDILLDQKQTAKYITQKIYRFLVNDELDEDKINWLANRFFDSGYEIKKLLEDIFLSSWFYEEKNIGSKIKSPVELLVGMRRMLPMDFENAEVQLLYQRLLGQVLFYPPNVAGWPGGKNWIDSSSLMFRLRIPQLLSIGEVINARPKDDDDVMMGQMDVASATPDNKMGEERLRKRLERRGYSEKEIDAMIKKAMAAKKERQAGTNSKAIKSGSARGLPNVEIDWRVYLQHFTRVTGDELMVKIITTLLQSGTVDLDLLHKYAKGGAKEDYIKNVTIRVMSTPEYQLC